MTESPRWYFREFLPGDNVSDPDFARALFSSEGEAPLARSLIREGIQNSLDARRDGQEGVRVHIRLLDVPAAEAYQFSGELWKHLKAETHGLEDPPTEGQPIACLVFEDFGTHGLRGDPEHWQPSDIQRNPFFLFFRALGRSGKSDEARGRWGVGKFVFPMSSKAHVIWGLTVPSDTRTPLLMGRTVLRTHTIGETHYHPDGHWGVRQNQDSQLVSAARDAAIVNRFRTLFGLERRHEPGLSIVVPWVDPTITLQGIRVSILEEYFMPLLREELTITLSSERGQEVIGADAVRAQAKAASTEAARRRLELAVAIADGKSQCFMWPSTFNYDDTEWRMTENDDGFRERLRGALESGSPVTVVLPVTVRPKNEPQRSGTLKLHLMASEGLGGVRPLLIRDGISVSEEKTKTIHDFAAILTADGCALAAMIGDAETPAHERLQHELLKNKYVYPRKMLSFMREAAYSLLRAVWAQEDGDDPLALASFFPVVEGAGKTRQKTSPATPGPEPEPAPTPEIPRTAKRFHVRRVEGGFRIAGPPGAETLPEQLSAIVAYDIRRGNPFKKYRSFDFDLGGSDIMVDAVDCEVCATAPNRLAIRPFAVGFQVTVTGFDEQRDLVVRVNALGGEE